MMDEKTLLNLSQQLRNCWGEALRSLAEADAAYTEASYNEHFWRSPHDWPICDSAQQATLGCMLFYPESMEALPLFSDVEYPRVFVEVLDGAFSVMANPGDAWKRHDHECYVPFVERVYHKNRSKYADQRETAAVWVLVGSENNSEYYPKICAGVHQYNRMCNEALSGVAWHADLTWDALEIQFFMNQKKRHIRLPKWGLRQYFMQVNPLFTEAENMVNVQNLLTGKTTRFRDKDGKLIIVIPEELNVSSYMNKLCHLLPLIPEQPIRLTGWFSSELMQEAANQQLQGRCCAIEFGYPYRAMKYE